MTCRAKLSLRVIVSSSRACCCWPLPSCRASRLRAYRAISIHSLLYWASPRPRCNTSSFILGLAQPHEDGPQALEALAEALGASGSPVVAQRRPIELPSGDQPLSNLAVMQIVSHYMPENAIVSDESLTASFPSYGLFDSAAPCDYLQLTGGSIGQGMPVATGAAVACPDRKVISLEGDGSAMYTLQALWTQARENLDVTTVIFANRAYAVLREELHKVGAPEGVQTAAMFDLVNPTLDWVKIAEGMGVEAVRVDTCRGLEAAFKAAMNAKGPRLIEAVI